jgi:hypothetical protein
MHRCEVIMNDVEGDDPDGYPCGDEAKRKLDLIWVCDYHWRMFQHVYDIGGMDPINNATDGVTRKFSREGIPYSPGESEA